MAKKARNYFVYVAAIFVSAIYALIGKPAPAWVMKATAQTASTAPAAHKTSVKQMVPHQAKRTARASKTASKRSPARRAQGKSTRPARKTVEKTGLSGAAIIAGEHHA